MNIKKSSVTVPCFFPGRAKDLSTPQIPTGEHTQPPTQSTCFTGYLTKQEYFKFVNIVNVHAQKPCSGQHIYPIRGAKIKQLV